MKTIAAALFAIMASCLEPALASPLLPDQAIQEDSEKVQWEKDLLELKSKEPADYEKLRAYYALTFHFSLARFGYIGGPFDNVESPELVQAIKAYESHRGLPVTGDLMSFETVRLLKRDVDAVDNEPLLLPSKLFHVDLWDRGWMFATGTWTLVGDTVAFPEQASHFRCDKSTMQCFEAKATVNRSGSTFGILSVDLTAYDIASWDQTEIVTVPSDAACARLVLRFNRVAKSVTSFRTKLSNDGLCEDLSDHLSATLVDGAEVSRKLRADHAALFKQFMQLSPAARKLLDESQR